MRTVVNGRPDITVLPCLLGILATEGTGICVKLYGLVNKHVKISEITLKLILNPELPESNFSLIAMK